MLDSVIDGITKSGERPRLLLHVCCAPCSSYVLEYLSRYFSITLLFYNPNISPRNEYDLRLEELYRLTKDMGLSEDVSFVECDYEPERFYEIAKGLESLPEGGERCKKCYELRLSKSAQVAAHLGFDYFTTTLSISPYKNAEWLNDIGKAQGELYGIKYLFSDFKKRNGYKRSCELSQKYGLYRQDYCGCIYSKVERDKQNGK
jgi:predicted adenine nucleotide alpha hydrolase (AANH) superfamily ATPase